MAQLINWLQEHIVTIASVLTAVGVVWKTCGKPIQELIKKIDRLDGDTADLLWDRLVEGHDRLVTRGWASSSDKQRMCMMYENYKAKGRNHIADSFCDDILSLPLQPKD